MALLGAPRVTVDGRPLEVDTRKAVALLAFLAVEPRAHRRDTLVALLWPDAGEARGRAALRRTLSVLRKALGAPTWLAVEGDEISLDAHEDVEDVWVDVRAFRAALGREAALDDLAAATRLHRGRFMTGFSLRDSDQFDEWQLLQAEHLQRELTRALARLVDGMAAAGRTDDAVTAGEQLLAVDPLHERAHRQLMALHAASGDRSAAVRQYRECVRVLHEELGVEPLQETTALYEQIVEGHAIAVPATPPIAPRDAPASAGDRVGAGAIAGPHPLIGRDAELSTLVDRYRSRAGGGTVVVVDGEAGVGKTRLVDELAAVADEDGAHVVRVRCYEGESTLAYAPFSECLRAALALPGTEEHLAGLSQHARAEAARLAPALEGHDLPTPPPLDGPGAQSRFYDGIIEVLLALTAGPAPPVIAFDDLQWGDDGSRQALGYLVRRIGGRPLCLVLAGRMNELPAGHALSRALADAERDGRAGTVGLRRLGFDETAELVAAIAPGDVTPDLVKTLYEETEGLPLFLVEYLALRDGSTPGGLPSGVTDMLRARVGALGDESRQLLTTAAVIGRSFDFDVAREASGRADDEVVRALDELVARGIVEERGDAFDFSHDKLRAFVYEQTSLARRRLLHRRVADALAGAARTTTDPVQLAHHLLQAGSEPEAAEQFRRAGDHARALYANADALAHYRDALALGHPDAAALHEAAGDLEALVGDYAAALASYERAAAWQGEGSLWRIEHKLGRVHHRRGEWEAAELHFEAALAGLGEATAATAAERSRVLADWSLTRQRRGDIARAAELAADALALADGSGDDRALAQTHGLLAIVSASAGDTTGALEHAARSLALAEQLGDPTVRVGALNNLALAHRRAGDDAAAEQLMTDALALCVAIGDRHLEAALHDNVAGLLHGTGRTEEAMAHLKQAVAIFAEIGVDGGEVRTEMWKLREWTPS